MNFNCLIKKWRKESGLTLEELAKKTNLTPQSISLYENEKRNVSFDTLQLFAKVFNKNIELNVKEKGEIIVSPTQKKKIEDIFFSEISIQNQYESFKELFDITTEEINARKLFDDMDEIEYVRFSPTVTSLNQDNLLYSKNLHSDEVFLYYACLSREMELNDDGTFKSVSIYENTPTFAPPRRTSKDGFITEQRRELLKLLIDCFKFKDFKLCSFDIITFRKRMGF